MKCFYHADADGENWTVSMYTGHQDVDVSEVCKKYGGGGHRGAAGFTCEEIPFKKYTGECSDEILH